MQKKQPQAAKPLTKKPCYCIGIDPGTSTGIAVWDTAERKFLDISTMKIHKALLFVQGFIDLYGADEVFLIVEDARKRKFDKGLTEEKKQGAGSIKRDGAIWDDFLSDIGVGYRMTAPNGRLNKLSENIPLWQANCKWTKTTSKHARDAAMLVLNF